ncbi:MAG: helix-hairpin-helix domain-containing protein [Desulfocapsaceae bacterium]|nr:helix-hairpin-helix domain-containing protein [Desulfocapsaceae bacterium]
MKKMNVVVAMMLSLLLAFSVSAARAATPTDLAKDTQVVKPAVPPPLPAPGAAIADKININTADEAALVKVKGIGKKKAEDIVAYRKEHGNFTSIEDLKKVKGIGPKIFDKVKPFITI